MKLFDRFLGGPVAEVQTLQCRSAELSARLAAVTAPPAFVCGFVSPHVDLEPVARAVTARLPGVPVMLCSTAGELCATGRDLYCPTGDAWDRVVLQRFDATLIARAEVVAVPLRCEDLRGGRCDQDVRERVATLREEIRSLKVEMDIDHRDTLAYILFDGLSASESFFMEALYDSGRFPCLFVGGSAGGKLDFRHTWLHDGHRKLENHALIAFLKLPRGMRFGVFKSHNFEEAGAHFPVIGASLEQRFVRQVIDKEGRIVSFIDALCEELRCTPHELDARLADYSFAIRVGDELFVRSVSGIDLAHGRVGFYCDIAAGEDLLLVRRTSLVHSTERDFRTFMEGKPGQPVAGILNDCILRRLYNGPELGKLGSVLASPSLAGFSTFGEILGLNLNQTLTAIFFSGRRRAPASVTSSWTTSWPITGSSRPSSCAARATSSPASRASSSSRSCPTRPGSSTASSTRRASTTTSRWWPMGSTPSVRPSRRPMSCGTTRRASSRPARATSTHRWMPSEVTCTNRSGWCTMPAGGCPTSAARLPMRPAAPATWPAPATASRAWWR